MKKSFILLNLILIVFVCGCSSNENVQTTNNFNMPKPQMTGFFSVKGIEGEEDGTLVESENYDDEGYGCLVKINEGEFLLVDAKIKSGYLEVKIGNRIYNFDKTQKFFIDLPKNELRHLPALNGYFAEIDLKPYNKFTGEVILKSSPKN